MLAKGKYKARAVEWSQVTVHEKTGNEEIRALFGVVGGEADGQTITWRGYFTEGTAERTIESLRYMGWAGDDITNVQGLDANEVQIVVEHEEYQGKTQVKVAWVNRAAGVFVGQAMPEEKKKAFAARMKGLVLATKGAAGGSPVRSSPNPGPRPAGNGGDAPESFPFGANAPKAAGVKL